MSTNTTIRKSRWPLSLAIIIVVVIISGVIIYFFRDAPGRLPVVTAMTGSGDTVVTWQDSGGIHAQRLNAAGELAWGQDEIIIHGATEKQYQILSDGADGVFLIWYEKTDAPLSSVPRTFHAQRIGSDGSPLWDEDLIIGDGSSFPETVPDGTGGAVFAWNDYRPFYRGLHEDILRLKKLDAEGISSWGDEGIVVAASTSYRELTDEEKAVGQPGTWTRSWPTYSGRFHAVSNGSGGVIVTWEEETIPQTNAVYSQNYNDLGEAAWPHKVMAVEGNLTSAENDEAGGVRIVTPQTIVHLDKNGTVLSRRSHQISEQLVPDGSGGFFTIKIEQDPPYGNPDKAKYTLIVQREDADGNAPWPEMKIIETNTNEQILERKYVADGTGGIIITWRLSKGYAPLGDLIAQRLDKNGNLQWGDAGMPVFDNPDICFQSVAGVYGDGRGGATIIAVTGTGALSGDSIYMQQLNADGNRLKDEGIQVKQ